MNSILYQPARAAPGAAVATAAAASASFEDEVES